MPFPRAGWRGLWRSPCTFVVVVGPAIRVPCHPILPNVSSLSVEPFRLRTGGEAPTQAITLTNPGTRDRRIVCDVRDPKSEFESGRCVNCDGDGVTLKTPLYCTPRCRQSAELIRHVRACRRDGRDRNPDVVEAMGTRLAMVLGGGYPQQERRVPSETRQLVFERAGGKCQECGRVLSFDPTSEDPDSVATIQHVSGNSSDLDNLLAFCRRCNLADAQSRFVPVAPGSAEAEYATELRLRWTADKPLRICDDDQRWNDIWRDLAKEAKDALEFEAELIAAGSDEDLPGFPGLTEQGTPIQDF